MMVRVWTQIRQYLADRFLRRWPDIALLVGLALSMVYAIESADWVDDNRSIELAITIGMFLGGLLVSTRWKGLFAGLYAFVTGLLFTSQVVGNIIPTFAVLLSNPFIQTLETVRINVVEFSLRVSGWVNTVAAGGSVNDTGLFLIVFSVLGWILSVYLVWWSIRRHQALVGVLPIGILMAVNAHLGQLTRIHMLAFLLLAVILVARTSFSAQHSSWVQRRLDYSEDLGGDWGVSAVMLAVATAMLAITFSFVGTREGWDVIRDLMERNRQNMADTAEQLFSGVNAPPEENRDDETPSITPPNLGEIGSPISQGSTILFSVKVSDPSPIPDIVRGEQMVEVPKHYWRSGIFSTYTGRGWEAAALSEVTAVEAGENEPPGRYRLTQHYLMKARHAGALFAVNQPVEASPGMTISLISPDLSGLVRGTVGEYEVVSFATRVSVAELAQAATVYPREIVDAYLQLPASLPERVQTLAVEVAGEGTVYSKAVRIQDYLRQRYAYSLDVGIAAAGVDVVDQFLFEQQEGFCSHFSSSMVVMLRAVGVPSRVVTGYATGSFSAQEQAYQVPASAAHAWVEVYFPGYGWVEFEPTPAYSPFTYPAGPSLVTPLQPGNLPPAPLTGSGWQVALWILAPVLLIALLWGGFFWLRHRRSASPDGKELAAVAYLRIKTELAWAGVPKAANLTPYEYRRHCDETLTDYPRLLDGLGRFTELYVRSAYSKQAPALHEVRMGQWRWEQGRWEWLRLLVKNRLFNR